MGAFGESFAAYAQPLLDDTDGSIEQMNSAFGLAQVCWNLALSPEEELDETLTELRPTLKMDDAEFEDFRLSVILPMIRRHREMFPDLAPRESPDRSRAAPARQAPPTTASWTEGYPGTGRNAPCPCGSGRKYKRCCRRKR